MVAGTEPEMQAMRNELMIVKDELAKMSAWCNELQTTQVNTNGFLTEMNQNRLNEIMWKSYGEAFPEMHTVIQSLDEKTHGNFVWMQERINTGLEKIKTDQDWIRHSRGNGNDQQQRRQKASESKAIACLKMLRDKKEFKQWHDKLMNGVTILYPKPVI